MKGPQARHRRSACRPALRHIQGNYRRNRWRQDTGAVPADLLSAVFKAATGETSGGKTPAQCLPTCSPRPSQDLARLRHTRCCVLSNNLSGRLAEKPESKNDDCTSLGAVSAGLRSPCASRRQERSVCWPAVPPRAGLWQERRVFWPALSLCKA
eukprot:366095-Chlamydomonas_euryale.AAC.17